MLLKNYVFGASALALASAAATPHQENKGVKLDFNVLRGDSTSDAAKYRKVELIKRSSGGSETLELTNMKSYYQVELNVGSNGDKCKVLIDTGSSDLWVMGSDIQCSAESLSKRKDRDSRRRQLSADDLPVLNDFEDESLQKRASTITLTAGGSIPTEYESILAGFSEYETNVGNFATEDSGYTAAASVCTALGSFNTAGSDSFKVNSSAPSFAISYADGSYAKGQWGQDSIDFKDFNVTDVSMAVVNNTNSNFGVLGIGLEGLETTNSAIRGSYTYENFPVRLKTSGAIKKVLYSLYLAEADSSKGSILFGAVDHAKYSGQLQTVPVLNIYPRNFKNPIRLDIALDSISLSSSSQNVSVTSSRIAALLDSGTTLTYLPTSILRSLANSLDASYSSSTGYFQISCNYNTDSAHVVFNFSGVQIKVPFSDLILSAGSQCYLGVLEQSSDSSTSYPYAILGDNFIRNAYIVYDLEDYEISLAQAEYTTKEDVEVVSSSVPSAVKAAAYSSTSLATAAEGSSSTELSSSGLKKSAGEHSAPIPKYVVLLAVGLGAIIAVS